ncbi:MAG: lipocalin family protein, partial [Microbacteriaceae bacterium]|nr:lipocalin family protein [Microbacteriaceae bacterium]
NPRVLEAVLRVMRFWLDLGVDGLRLDAVPYLVERDGTNNENLPETHDILKRIRAALDADYRWALVVGPDRSYCWILSRTKQLPPGVREQLVARASALGRPARVERRPHDLGHRLPRRAPRIPRPRAHLPARRRRRRSRPRARRPRDRGLPDAHGRRRDHLGRTERRPRRAVPRRGVRRGHPPNQAPARHAARARLSIPRIDRYRPSSSAAPARICSRRATSSGYCVKNSSFAPVAVSVDHESSSTKVMKLSAKSSPILVAA